MISPTSINSSNVHSENYAQCPNRYQHVPIQLQQKTDRKGPNKTKYKIKQVKKKKQKRKRKKDRTWRWMGRQLVKFCVVFVCYELHSRTSKLVSNYRVNSLALGFLAGFTHSKIFYITLAKLTHTKFILLCQKHKEELSFAHTHTHTYWPLQLHPF